jgi:hypothetical protein
MNRRLSLASTASLALVSVLVVLSHAPALGDTFEWVDKTGHVRSADSLEKVPPPYRSAVKRIPDESTQKPSGTFQTVPGTSMPSDPGSSLPSLESTYAPWRERIRIARAQLDALKEQRRKVQTEYDEMLRQRNVRGNALDPKEVARASSRLDDLDRQIRTKENEITTTIPDDARRAGVPSSALTQ